MGTVTPNQTLRSDSLWSDTSGTALVDPSGKLRGVAPLLTSTSAFEASILNHATNTYISIGYDDTDNVAFVRDDSGGRLLQGTSSDSWATTAGVTWSTSKGLPTAPNAVLYSSAIRIIRFGAYLYLYAKDSVTNLVGIYRALPASGNTPFTWSAVLQQYLSTAAGQFFTCFSAGSGYLWLAEYGDPTGGPTAWRSADGTTWTQIYTEVGQSPPQRHIHAIAPDPYVPGDVYMTMGDANAPREVMVSHDYGTTWSVLTPSSSLQAVQISFSPNYVWFAGDSQRGHLWVLHRATGKKLWACVGQMRRQAVPAAAAVTDEFYYNGFLGCVDPETEEYYFGLTNDGSGGNTGGLCYVPYVGATPVLLEKLTYNTNTMFIAGGYLWSARGRRRLHTVT